jgi:hypothetical protein
MRSTGAPARCSRGSELQPGDDGRQMSAPCRAAGRCASRSPACCSCAPTPCCSTSRVEPPRPREPHLARALPQEHTTALLLMTSHDREFMDRIVTQDRRDRRRRAHHAIPAKPRVLRRSSARSPRSAAAGPVRAPAGDARQGASASSSASRRAPPTPRRCRAASKQLAKIERVEPPKRRQTILFEFPPCRRARAKTSRALKQRAQALRQPAHLRAGSTSRFAGANVGASWASMVLGSRPS